MQSQQRYIFKKQGKLVSYSQQANFILSTKHQQRAFPPFPPLVDFLIGGGFRCFCCSAPHSIQHLLYGY